MPTPDNIEEVYQAVHQRVLDRKPAIPVNSLKGPTGLSGPTIALCLKSLVEAERLNRWKPTGAGQFTPYHYGIVGIPERSLPPPPPDDRPRRMSAQDKLDARIRAAQEADAKARAQEPDYQRIIAHNPPPAMSDRQALANVMAIARDKGTIGPDTRLYGTRPARKPVRYPTCECGRAYNPRDGETRCIVCIEAETTPVPCANCGQDFYPHADYIVHCPECSHA